MLSNSNSNFILNLYKEYNIDKITAKRAVNCNGNGRTGAKEIIVRNYEEG
jgi:DNA adenine methylase